MRALLPYPLLAASLLAMWILLNGLTPGHLLLGTVIALAAARIMAALQPSKPQLRRWQLVPQLFFTVMVDVVRSNAGVARIALSVGDKNWTAGFVAIPLDLRDPTGLALLACIVTATPGTAWIEYDTNSGVLLLHVLDLVDEDHWIELIKNRYESMLREIFE